MLLWLLVSFIGFAFFDWYFVALINAFVSAILVGVDALVRFNPKLAGGETDITNKVVTIGTKNKKEILNILFHEIGEAIGHERGVRYTRYEEGNDGVRFLLTHHEYENIIADIVAVVSQFPK